MESFVKFITNPAWWSVIFTAISTVAVIFIAIAQIRLQKRQIKAQEYDFYKQLYDIICDADLEINNFLFSIYAEMQSNRSIDSLIRRLDEMSIKFYDTERLIMQKFPDFKLRTDDGEIKVRAYQYILIGMSNITSFIKDSAQKSDGIRKVPTNKEKEYSPSTIITDREVQKSLIVSRIINETYANSIDSFITQFLKDKKEIEAFKYAEHIAKHCTDN